MYAVIKNSYFKLLVNNITLPILEVFSLEKIDSNIKIDISFLYFLIQVAIDVKRVSTIYCDHDISTTIFFTANSKKKLYFCNSQIENNNFNKYNSSDELNESLHNN